MKTLIVYLIFTGTAFAQSVDQQIDSLKQKRIAIESIIDAVPYSTDSHTTIEDYFKSMNALALEIKDFPKSQKRFNNSASKTGIEKFCKETFLDVRRWSDLSENCNKNGFFLCAEEVRSFDIMKESLKNSLYADSKKKFEASAFCK